MNLTHHTAAHSPSAIAPQARVAVFLFHAPSATNPIRLRGQSSLRRSRWVSPITRSDT